MSKTIYGKLIDGTFVKAPTKVKWHGKTVINPRPEKLIELGYKPLVEINQPDWSVLEDNQYWTTQYSEDEKTIYKEWIIKTFEEEITVNN